MEKLDEHDAAIRLQLQTLRQQLTAKLEHFEQWRRSQSGYGHALVDDAGVSFDQAAQRSLQHSTEQLLVYVEQALQRLEAGSYGICEGCRKRINPERLQAVIHARLCVTCQQLQEQSPLGRLAPPPRLHSAPTLHR